MAACCSLKTVVTQQHSRSDTMPLADTKTKDFAPEEHQSHFLSLVQEAGRALAALQAPRRPSAPHQPVSSHPDATLQQTGFKIYFFKSFFPICFASVFSLVVMLLFNSIIHCLSSSPFPTVAFSFFSNLHHIFLTH